MVKTTFEESLLFTIENMTDGFLFLNQEWDVACINKEASRLWTMPRNELIGKKLWDIIPKTLIPTVRSHYSTAMEKRMPVEFEVSWPDLDALYEARIYPSPEGISIQFRDIGDRKKNQRLLEESEERYRTAVEQANDGIVVTRGLNILYANKKYLDIFGYANVEAMPDQSIACTVHEDDRARVIEMNRRRWTGEEVPAKYSFKGVRRDGAVRYIEVSAAKITANGEPVSLAYLSDVTSRVREEEERKRLAMVLEQTEELVVITDKNGVVRYINKAFEDKSGYRKEEVLGKHHRFLKSGEHDESFYTGLRQTLEEGRLWTGRMVHEKKDGTFQEIETRMFPVRNETGEIMDYVSVSRDITNEIKLEEQLRQAQKMEAIGTLAGGVAHDFNNILAVIMGNVELALDDATDNNVRHNLDQIFAASKRGRDLVKQILAFSRKSEGGLKETEISALVKETARLLRSSLPSTIRIELNIRSTPCVVMADPSQIQQILMNLSTNAAHAMRHTGGVLHIELEHTTLRKDNPILEEGMPDGGYAKLSVRDTGSGIAAHVRKRMFEPFFTTKGPGQGTGMGLAVVYGIVRGHKGTIQVETAPHKGSTFSVFFPATALPNGQVQEEVSIMPEGNERILFVDDEEQIVEISALMLERLGYEVTATTNALHALELFRKDPQGFDLMITDQTMPEMTGLELADAILRQRRDFPVILCTGYSDTVSAETAKNAGIREFTMKPLVKHEIAGIIRKVLDG